MKKFLHAFVRPLPYGRIITLYVVFTALLPAIYSYATGGLRALFDFFAADAFTYLSVADASDLTFYTFDGENPTNGFHPLWQLFLNSVFEVLGLGAKSDQVTFAFWVSVSLVTASGVMVARTVLRWSGSAVAAMLTFPGVFGIGMMLCGWLAGTMWHFMNGMESPFSLFFFGILVSYLSRFDTGSLIGKTYVNRKRLITLSILMIGVVLSRLDDGFLAAVIVIWALLQSHTPFANRIQAAFWVSAPLGSALLAYLFFNYAAVGYAIPISAAAKFGLQVLWSNLELLGMSLRELMPDVVCKTLGNCPHYVDISFIHFRNAQMLMPIILAVALLVHINRAPPDQRTGLPVWMQILLSYVIVKGLYNFLFVPLIHQGHWYYPISITIVNIGCGIYIARAWNRFKERHRIASRIGIPAAAVATFFSMIVFIRVPSTTDAYYNLFKRGPEIATILKSRVKDPRIIEADDGIINYSLNLPTLSGFLFAIDPKGYRAFKQGRFLTEASARGYQLIGSFYYLRSTPPHQLTPDKIPAILRKHLFFADQWGLEEFDFELIYRDIPTGATFIQFTPKNDPPRATSRRSKEKGELTKVPPSLP